MRYTIEGGSLPVLLVQLDQGEAMLSEAGGRVWSRGPVVTDNKAEGGVGQSIGRLFAGESLFMSTYMAQGAVEIAFAPGFPGSIVVRELKEGESILCQKGAFLCATYGVTVKVDIQKKVGAGLFGGEGFIMQRVTGPGLAFFEIDGYAKEYVLQPGEQIVCDTTALALMDTSCQMDIRMVSGVKNMVFGGEGLLDTVINGPGRVHLQTMSIPQVAGLISRYIPSK